MDISVIIPLFNEAESLPELSSWIARVMAENGYSYEVLMVDDGSNDGSWDVVKSLSAEDSHIHGISFRRNYGRLSLTRRITDGLLIAFADTVATDDATAVVHATVLEVDARGLAILGTQSALDAAVAVDAHFQP